MAIASKRLTSATSTNNIYAPFEDRLIASYHLTETSGTSFANIGRRATLNASTADLGATAEGYGGGAIAFVDAATDPVNGPHLTTDASTSGNIAVDGMALVLMDNTAGSAISLPQGTLMIRFKAVDATGAITIFTSGAGFTTDNSLNIDRLANSTLRIRLRIGGSNYDCNFANTSQITWTNWQTLILCWGAGQNFTAYLNRNNTTRTADGGTESVAQTAGWEIAASSRCGIGLSALQTTSYAIHVSYVGLWDKRVDQYTQSSKDLARLLGDPWLPIRPAPDIDDVLSTNVSAMSSRPTSSSIHVSLVSGLGDTGDLTGVLASAVSAKVLWGTSDDPTSANFCNQVEEMDGVGADEIITQLAVTISGLSPDTTYFYRVEYTTDDFSTQYPLPGGLQRFKTKRTAEGTWRPALYSDDHFIVSGLGVSTPIVYGAANYYGGVSPQALAFEKAILFNTLQQDADFFIHTGDWYMPDLYTPGTEASVPDIDDRNDLAFWQFAQLAAAYRNFAHRMFADSAGFFALGNHELENGFSQNGNPTAGPALSNNLAGQALATNIRKMYFPNPTNETYDEGGESEGPPSKASDRPSWVPNLSSGIFEAYNSSTHRDYFTDYIDGPSSNPRDLNTSPLENYYAFEWGGGDNRALFVVLDGSRYTSPGDPESGSVANADVSGVITTNGYRQRPIGSFTYGEVQTTWAEGTLEASTAPHKFLLVHNYPGGVRCGIASNTSTLFPRSYGRQSGATEGGSEFLALMNKNRQVGLTAFIHGHDHKFCHVIRETVNHIALPTCSAPSLSVSGAGGNGWHFSEIEQNAGYGLAESDGADLVTLGDGGGTALGIRKMINCMGVATLEIGESCTLRMIRTEVARTDAGATLNETPLHFERNAGELLTAASDVVTTSLTPVSVTEAYLSPLNRDRNSGTPFWSTIPSSVKGSASGLYPYDEERSSASVTLASSVNENAVYVMVTPSELYEAVLENAQTSTDSTFGNGHDHRNIRASGGLHEHIAEVHDHRRPARRLVGVW